MLAIVRRSFVLRGYIYTEFVDEHYDAFLREIGPRVRSGAIRYQEDVVDGLDRAPEVFIGVPAGRRFGEAIVRLSRYRLLRDGGGHTRIISTRRMP